MSDLSLRPLLVVMWGMQGKRLSIQSALPIGYSMKHITFIHGLLPIRQTVEKKF